MRFSVWHLGGPVLQRKAPCPLRRTVGFSRTWSEAERVGCNPLLACHPLFNALAPIRQVLLWLAPVMRQQLDYPLLGHLAI